MMNTQDFQKCVLAAEIIALLHDIGKFTSAFMTGSGKNHTAIHTYQFRDPGENLCLEQLLAALEQKSIPITPDGQNQLRAVGDLQNWHHYRTGFLEEYFLKEKDKKLPLLLYLMMYADTLDSATSKGGAAFEKKKAGETGPVLRQARFNIHKGNQSEATCHIATPFGQEEQKLYDDTGFALAKVNEKVSDFQKQLADILKTFDPNELDRLSTIRSALLDLMELSLSHGLAETRIPNNDVTLWQHSSSATALFKAMLAGHLLNGKYDYCEEEGDLTHYKEKLAIIGFCWSEDELISRSFRAKEILGRRKRLDDAAEAVKAYMETDLCLGNEIYRDRDGIYFLVPELTDEVKTNGRLSDFAQKIDQLLNGEVALAGELTWECRSLSIGQQITRLPEVMTGGKEVEVIASGPMHPRWAEQWRDTPAKSVCPRCGLRPVEMPLVVSGSEGDDSDKICGQCKKLMDEGVRYRGEMDQVVASLSANKKRRRLTGIDKGCRFFTYDMNELLKTPEKAEEGRNRLTLLQGLVDLRPFFSGEAFSSMLAAEPIRFDRDNGTEDKSLEMKNWETMLEACKDSWGSWQQKNSNTKYLHSLQQIFYDHRLGTEGDGRAPGENGLEKGINYLRDTVLMAPFASHLSGEHARLVNYALRKHPAPSRLARIWNSTLDFCCSPMSWCENNRIPYSTISLDPGRFLILVAAREAEGLLNAIHGEYGKRFGRVRHHLALHLSATVFYYKSPLYIGIDASRRFADIGLQRSDAPQWWEVNGVEGGADETAITLCTTRGRQVVFKYPRKLPNGKDDRFYPWFWVQENQEHPVHLDELKKGSRVAVRPGSFDYEVLDATSRRYDIRMDDTARPHPVKRSAGPRPYPLETLDQFQRLKEVLNQVEVSQLKHLQELIGRLHRDWNNPRCGDSGETLRGVAEDILRNVLEKNLWRAHGREMLAMACDGSLFDLLEWYFFISL